jgi:hypothetical protein
MMQDLDRFVQLFSQEFSGLRAKRTVSQLTQLHRIQASPGLSAAVDLMHQLAEAAGLADVQTHRYPVDGKSYWWTWKKPWFWSPQSAELRLVAPEEEVLARFEDEPCHLGTLCAPTPPGGITAEVVDVGRGLTEKDYEGKDVAGKAVLVSGAGWGYRAATKMASIHGAVGMITDSIVEVPPARTLENAPEQIAYGRVWVEEDGSSVFCFGISYRQMQRLKKLMAESSGPLKVHATVETTLSEGELPVLSGVIEGDSKPDEEVLFIAHICHPSPGANDNASGSALILEVARAWCHVIAEGKLPRPARTIRFLWVAEWDGTIAYLHANPDWPARLQGVICCDMVGENQQLCGGPLVLERTPDTLPSYLNDLGERFLEQLTAGGGSYFSASAADLWKYQVGPYGGGSDNAPFVDSTWGVPAIAFGHWPDRFYHSSHDTLEKVDSAEMERVAWVVSQLAQVVANAGPSEAALLARETLERGLRRLSQEASEALWALYQTPSEAKEGQPYAERMGARIRQALDALDYQLEVEKGAVASVQRLADDDPKVAALIADYQTELEDKLAQLREQLLATGKSLAGAKVREAANLRPELSEQEQESDRLIPVQHWMGPLDVLYYPPEVLGWEKTAWLIEHMTQNLGVFTMLGMAALWVDGKRSLLEIARRVALGTGMEVDLEVLLHYFRDLAETGVVSLQER